MKLKTRKSIAKRVKLTGAKKGGRWGKVAKMVRKTAGQDHFNAAESSTVTRKKRRARTVTGLDKKNVRRLVPKA